MSAWQQRVCRCQLSPGPAHPSRPSIRTMRFRPSHSSSNRAMCSRQDTPRMRLLPRSSTSNSAAMMVGRRGGMANGSQADCQAARLRQQTGPPGRPNRAGLGPQLSHASAAPAPEVLPIQSAIPTRKTNPCRMPGPSDPAGSATGSTLEMRDAFHGAQMVHGGVQMRQPVPPQLLQALQASQLVVGHLQAHQRSKGAQVGQLLELVVTDVQLTNACREVCVCERTGGRPLWTPLAGG